MIQNDLVNEKSPRAELEISILGHGLSLCCVKEGQVVSGHTLTNIVRLMRSYEFELFTSCPAFQALKIDCDAVTDLPGDPLLLYEGV